MTSTIIDVNNKVDLADFYAVAKEIRERNHNFELPWTEPEDIKEFLEENQVNCELFIVRSEEGSGRIMAYQFKDKPDIGYLGWYECDEVSSISSSLLLDAENWLKGEGVSSIKGPMNGSSWGTFRFNLDSDSPVFASEPYQPLYYVDQWKHAGFEQDVVYQTNIVPKEISKPMTLDEVQGLAAMIGVKYNAWPHNVAEDDEKLKDMHDFFHSCFKDNVLYRPVSFEKYRDITKKLESIIDFEHSFIVSDMEDKPVSVLISYKDIYNGLYEQGKLKNVQHATKTLYMKTICTAPKWRGNHISRALVNYGLNVAYINGYEEVVFGTMMVDNNSAKYSRSFFNAQAHRTYAFMSKDV